MLRNYINNIIKYIVYIVFFLFSSIGSACSYEDFFNAIRKDEVKVISSLFDRGFDPNTVDLNGEPAILNCLRHESFKVFELIVKHPKTQVNVRNSHGESALMLVSLKGDLELAKTLIKRDADINHPGWTPLHYASSKGHIQMMRLLMENDAYLDAESPNGTTPLMMAAHYGTPSAVKLLLEEGADPRIKNKLGINAMEFANHSLHPQAQDARNYIQAFLSAWKQRYPDTPINSTKSE